LDSDGEVMATNLDSLWLNEEQRTLRAHIRRFVDRELKPHVDQWERECGFPVSVYEAAGRAGVLGVGFPEEFGGAGGGLFEILIVTEELTRSGSPGLAASLGSHSIGLPPVANAGTEAQKRHWMPGVLNGEWIASLAITEPGTGSDVASVATRATRVDGGWRLNGRKLFITSGTRARLLTVAARTGGEGAGGVSVFAVDASLAGVHVERNLSKMGWHASDTAELVFDDVLLPDDALLGEENQGFVVLMQNFACERLMLAAQATEMAQMALDACHDWVKERRAFGKPLGAFQVTRHKLADMATRIEAARALTWTTAARIERGEHLMGELAMTKNTATDTCSYVVDQAVQLFGGMGYMHGTLVERLYRDARLYPIGGGTREIMNEIISRSF
jgi:acyl-CoA dehydrogenase